MLAVISVMLLNSETVPVALHPLAFGDRRRAAAAEDEDAFGGRRVGVGVGVLLLEEEALELVGALEVAR